MPTCKLKFALRDRRWSVRQGAWREEEEEEHARASLRLTPVERFHPQPGPCSECPSGKYKASAGSLPCVDCNAGQTRAMYPCRSMHDCMDALDCSRSVTEISLPPSLHPAVFAALLCQTPTCHQRVRNQALRAWRARWAHPPQPAAPSSTPAVARQGTPSGRRPTLHASNAPRESTASIRARKHVCRARCTRTLDRAVPMPPGVCATQATPGNTEDRARAVRQTLTRQPRDPLRAPRAPRALTAAAQELRRRGCASRPCPHGSGLATNSSGARPGSSHPSTQRLLWMCPSCCPTALTALSISLRKLESASS